MVQKLITITCFWLTIGKRKRTPDSPSIMTRLGAMFQASLCTQKLQPDICSSDSEYAEMIPRSNANLQTF